MTATHDGERSETKLASVRVDVVSRPVRTRSGIWWCPFCDRSQMFPATVCGGCGAEYTTEGGGRAVKVKAPTAKDMLAAPPTETAPAVETAPAADPPAIPPASARDDAPKGRR